LVDNCSGNKKTTGNKSYNGINLSADPPAAGRQAGTLFSRAVGLFNPTTGI